MILKLLLNLQIIWMIFTKIFNNIIQNKKHQTLIVFDYMIADVLSNEKLNAIVTELFIRGINLNISLVFMTQSYFTVPENISLIPILLMSLLHQMILHV